VRNNVLPRMRLEVRSGIAATDAEYIEYWWDDHQRAVLEAVHAGDTARADELIAAARPRINAALEPIGQSLAMLRLTGPYVEFWSKAARMSAADYKALLARRQAELPRRVWNYSYYSVVLDKVATNTTPPTGYGRGGARHQMRIHETADVRPREQFRGDWLAGLHQEGGQTFAVFAEEPDASSRAGDYVELAATLPLPQRRERLGLLMYMNRWTKDKLGGEEVAGRWMGYAAAQVLWGDKVLWQGDLGLPRTGCEWDVVPLPTLPADLQELPLRIRVSVLRDSSGMRTIAFVGPPRLVELPG
jgi:hypothetical protein